MVICLALFFMLRIILSIKSLFLLYMNFMIVFFLFVKNNMVFLLDFDWCSSESVNDFWYNRHLTNNNSISLWVWYLFLFSSVFISFFRTLDFLLQMILAFLVRYISIYYIFFETIRSGSVSMTSLWFCWWCIENLLICASWFCVLPYC